MRNQDREIQRPPPSCTAKMHRPHVRVVVKVRNKEQRRTGKCRQHRRTVCGALSASDQGSSGEQQNGAATVQSRVDLREDGVLDHGAIVVIKGNVEVKKQKLD